ncbi:MAG: sulfite exporter TauE/SafE family protein [Rhodospirillales bacterium]|nr:sulfite exporter TauE/SafE family protein [Rhodospirillales bacterium]
MAATCPGVHPVSLIQINAGAGGVPHGLGVSDLAALVHRLAVAVPAGLCTPDTVRGGLLGGLFLAGLAGGVMHCGPMCGGFVLGQTADRMARLPAGALSERRRIGAGLLLPYHLGRLTTYAALGAAAGMFAGVLGRAPWFGRISAALLALAGLVFLAEALRRVAPGLPRLPRAHLPCAGTLARFARRFDPARPGGGYALGVTLGFLPCGLLYGALTAAAASGAPAPGAAAMAAFAFGTMPALIAVGIAGQAAGARFARAVRLVAPVLLAGNGAVLLGLAWLGA